MNQTRHIDDIENNPQSIVSFTRDLNPGDVISWHCHRRAQLVYASAGVMTVTTRSAAYMVPSQRAVWMPASIEHRIDAHRALAMRSLYIDPAKVGGFPPDPTVLQITPLLRELVITAVSIGNSYSCNGSESRIMAVILDQIVAQPGVSLGLPQPGDPRLLRITRPLMKTPGDGRTLDHWARHAGASKRTINRLFTQETGMPFQSWRQQLRLQRGLELLAAGDSVTLVAQEVGYDSTSAFIAMFRRCLGTTPTRYLHSTS